MKYIILFFFLISSISLSAQKEGQWSIELRSSYDRYFYDEIEYMNILPTSGGTGWHITDAEFNFGLGLQAALKVNEIFDFGFGLAYSNRKAKVICYCHFCDKQANPPQSRKIDFFKAPIFIRFRPKLKSEKIKPYLLAGTNFRTNFAEEFKNGFRQMQIEAMAGLGIEHKLSEKFSLSLEGLYLQDTKSISELEDFTYSGMSFALGVNYALGAKNSE